MHKTTDFYREKLFFKTKLVIDSAMGVVTNLSSNKIKMKNIAFGANNDNYIKLRQGLTQFSNNVFLVQCAFILKMRDFDIIFDHGFKSRFSATVDLKAKKRCIDLI